MKLGKSKDVQEAKMIISEHKNLIDSFNCKIPEISKQIDWGTKKKGQGRRSGDTILGSMSAAPYGIKTYYGVDISKYLSDWPFEVFKYLDNHERARYYKAREYGCNKIEARLYAYGLTIKI